MYRIPIYQVRLVRDGSQPSARKKVDSPATAAQVLQQYLDGADREHFVVLRLDTPKPRILASTPSRSGRPTRPSYKLSGIQCISLWRTGVPHPLFLYRFTCRSPSLGVYERRSAAGAEATLGQRGDWRSAMVTRLRVRRRQDRHRDRTRYCRPRGGDFAWRAAIGNRR